MKFKKLLCLCLCVLLLLLSACKNGDGDSKDNSSVPTPQTETAATELSLLYSAADSLNPYEAKTELNQKLSLLMFDPLVKLDDAFQPQRILAKSVEMNGKECIVTLKSAVFTDGTPVTADDVVFSLDKLFKTELNYKHQLKDVKSYKAESTDTIKFTLTKADPYFENLLDFPIIKKDSDTRKDENNIALPPIGSGRYVFDTKNKVLTANNMWVQGWFNVKTIELIDAPDKTVEKYNLEVNNISIFQTDLSDGVVPPMSGNSSLLELNSLIYLGVNLSNSTVSQAKFRYALSAALDRTAICNDAYHGYASPAAGLFNSKWSDAGALQNIDPTANLEIVVANFEEIGYNSKDENGFLVNDKSKNITLKLVSYKDNARRDKAAAIVKQQLESVGIKVNLVSLNWKEYTDALTFGNFDLYIAETRLNNNMDVTELVTSTGSLAYGIPESKNTDTNTKTDTTVKESTTDGVTASGDADTQFEPSKPTSAVPLLDNAVKGFYNEQLSLVDIINAFNAEMPVIPLCHRRGITVCKTGINAVAMSSLSDAYFGISNIK